jgi:hypothetical protein
MDYAFEKCNDDSNALTCKCLQLTLDEAYKIIFSKKTSFIIIISYLNRQSVSLNSIIMISNKYLLTIHTTTTRIAVVVVFIC